MLFRSANTDAEEDRRYAYKVTAVNAAGESPESEIFAFGLQLAAGEGADGSQSPDRQPSSDNGEPSAPQPDSVDSSVQPSEQTQTYKTVIIIAVVLAAAVIAVLAAVLIRRRGRK